jgi:hypothetical protein
MSTSLLYHAFGIRGYKYKNTKYEGGSVHFNIEQERKYLSLSVLQVKGRKAEGEGDTQVQVNSDRAQGSIHCADAATGFVYELWGSKTGKG